MKRLALCALLASLISTAWAQASLVIQRCPLAGFTHHEAPALWNDIREGDRLELSLERANSHDAQAVLVRWREQTIGYLPRTLNGAIARALAEREPLEAFVHKRREHPDPRRRIEIEIRMPLEGSHE